MTSLAAGVSHIDVKALQALTHVHKTDKSTFYKAKWGDKQVFIKTLIPENIIKGDKEDFLYEIRMMAIFRQCSGFVQLYGTTELEGGVAIVMEVVEMVLKDFLADESCIIGWPEKYSLARQTAQAVDYMHQLKILHGDLKSLNILVNRKLLEVKLCDFGYTFQESDPGGHLIRLARDRDSCGSPLWVPLERIRYPVSDFNSSCEVYSLGMVMYEIGARLLPFSTIQKRMNRLLELRDITRRLECKLHERLPADSPQEYVTITEQARDFDPDKRPSSATIVKSLNEAISRLNQALESRKINDSNKSV